LIERADPPDHIVIETSGLALPKPLVKAFTWPEVRARVTVDGVIAVVDAPAVADGRFAAATNAAAAPAADHESPVEEVFEDQILCADLVLLNKTDQIDEPGLAAVRASIAEHLRPAAKVVPSRFGAVDPRVLLGLDVAAEDDVMARRSHHDNEDDHDHEEFESFVATLPALADPAALEARIKAVAAAHDVLRIKGFIDVPGKDRRHVVQAVGPRVERYFDRPWASGEERRSRLVVIGRRGLDRAAIQRTLAG
jgi:cobalamin biosynthesis protein CobW